jgi:hypothetical protein
MRFFVCFVSGSLGDVVIFEWELMVFRGFGSFGTFGSGMVG